MHAHLGVDGEAAAIPSREVCGAAACDGCAADFWALGGTANASMIAEIEIRAIPTAKNIRRDLMVFFLSCRHATQRATEKASTEIAPFRWKMEAPFSLGTQLKRPFGKRFIVI